MSAEKKLLSRIVDEFGAYLLIGFVTLGCVIVGIHLSYTQAERDIFAQTSFIAGEVLQRSEIVTDQMMSAVTALESRNDPNPCSAANIDLMKSRNIASSYLQLVGYIRNNHLICSSYGMHADPIDLGAPTYISSANFAVRTKIRLPPDDSLQYVASTHVSTGFTVFVLPNLPLDVAKSDQALGLGVYAAASGITIINRGKLNSEWFRTNLTAGETSYFVTATNSVTLMRSKRYQFVGYCAFPIARLYAAWRTYAYFFVPLGILIGLCLSGGAILFARRHLGMRQQLREAIKSDTQLSMVYQPIVELASGRWVGAESLVRWRQIGGQVIPPDVFVPIAELTGLMPRLTARIVEMVAKDMSMSLRPYPNFHININFSASDLESPASLDQLHRQLRSFRISEKQVTVEVTEGSLLKIEYAKRNISLMRNSGLSIAIDDFGTGYCGLSYLVSLNLDFLKIDKSFVDTIGTDAATRSVIPHIIQMAKTLGLEVIAEGVEREEQADYLHLYGVKYVQGWLYAKPMPIDELVKKIAERRDETDTLTD